MGLGLMTTHRDTIFAPATAPGRAGIAIIRLSGAAAGDALVALGVTTLPSPRMATRVRLLTPQTAELIDDAIVIYYPAPHSYTGEDVVEFQIHGGRATMQEMIAALSCLPDLRLAEPGEFTKRAFLNGKLDLTAAEGVADLIDAETSAQKRQALRQLQGEHGRLFESLRERLITCLAHIEAYLDFPDEDIPDAVIKSLNTDILSIKNTIYSMLHDNSGGEKIREGFYAVILGAPNAGKSSLMNALAKQDVAIVSSTAGTTRDVIEIHLDIDGLPVTLADTAGLRDSTDEIESEGIRRAIDRSHKADVKIALFDATSLPDWDSATLKLVDASTLILLSKWDLVPQSTVPPALSPATGVSAPLPISVTSGYNIARFLSELSGFIATRYLPSSAPVITRTRHRAALRAALERLEHFSTDLPLELASEELRLAARSIGKITGRIEVDDVLDVIFRSFCIGK